MMDLVAVFVANRALLPLTQSPRLSTLGASPEKGRRIGNAVKFRNVPNAVRWTGRHLPLTLSREGAAGNDTEVRRPARQEKWRRHGGQRLAIPHPKGNHDAKTCPGLNISCSIFK